MASIDADDVRRIASDGFPLWEAVDVMVERNRRITLGYADLSRDLAELIAGDDKVLDANWCTFATWSSRTIGTWIEGITHAHGHAVATIPPSGPLPGRFGQLCEHVGAGPFIRQAIARSSAASFRTLAAGNRAVFLEVGLSIATLLRHFPTREAACARDADQRWDRCWRVVEAQIERFSTLDPSWMLTPSPPPDDLRHGLHHYVEALRADDRELRSQHVLAANLLVAAYEQRRVDGYVWAALALFTEHAMQRLVRDRTGAVGGVRRWPSNLFAGFMTGHMTLLLCDEPVPLCEPIRSPRDLEDRWRDMSDQTDVTLPVLQALITRYQLAIGHRRDEGAGNWTSFDERMRTIGNLFMLRQRQAGLFAEPFTADETARLRCGRIAPEVSEQRASSVGAMGELRERRLVFGEDAAGYDDARPSYPAALIDDLVELVGPEARMLDVGTGTAKATRLLAERGITGIGIEADPAMAAVAREHLAPHPGWRVDVSDFEWWRPTDGDAPVDLVGSAQAWHWVHPQVGLWRAHRLLRPGGAIALWWNLAEEDTSPARQEIDAAYAEHAPDEMFTPTIDRNEGSPFDPAPADARFVDDATRLYPWTYDYSTDELLALLRTTSNHRVMAPERSRALLDAVATIVDRHGGTFSYPYVTRLWTARRP